MSKPVIALIAALASCMTLRPAVADQWSRFLATEDVRRIQYERTNKVYWFGTDNNGLWRFDGRQFMHFSQTSDGRTIQYITTLAIDVKHEKLWVGTESGLFCYHFRANRWEYFDEKSGLSKNRITALLVDRSGTLWYGAVSEDQKIGGGIGKRDDTGWYRYTTGEYAKWDSTSGSWVSIPDVEPIPSSPETSVARSYYDCIAQDAEGNLLFGSRGAGLCILDKSARFWQTCFVDFPATGLFWGYILSIAVDRQGNVWMGTLEGVCRWNRANASVTGYTPSNSGLVERTVNTIWIETQPDGELKWFGTNGGVSVLDSTHQVWESFKNENSGLGSNAIRDISGDDDGNLWFASLQGRGVSKLNRGWTTLKTAQGLSSNFVFAASKDQFGRLWVGTDQSGVEVLEHGTWRRLLENASCRMLPRVTAFLADSGGMWVASQCGIFKFELSSRLSELSPYRIAEGRPSGFPSNDVRAIAVRQNTLWAGTAESGLVRVDLSPTGPSLRSIIRAELPSGNITALAYDAQARLWVGTDKGLTIHDGDDWLLVSITPLPPNTGVSALARDLTGAMWVGTDLGLLRFDDNNWQHFTVANGLPDNRITSTEVAASGDVWCGTVNGAAAYTGDAWVAFTTHSTNGGLSDDFISDIALGPAGVVWFATYGGGISRYYKNTNAPITFLFESFRIVTETNVTFRYSGYDSKTDSLNLRYQYALDDFSTWTDASPNNLTLPIAEDGRHTFSVRAIDEDGNVDVTPPQVRFHKISSRFGRPVTIVEPGLGQNLDSLWLYVPPSALAEGSTISFMPVVVDTHEIADHNEGIRFMNVAFRLLPESQNTALFDQRPVTMTIFYNAQNLMAQDVDARALAIYRREGRWLLHGGSVDAGRHAITTTIAQLDTFALFLNPSGKTVADGEIVFGNLAAQPRMLSSQFSEKITVSFDLGRPTNVTTKVYNLAGRLVRRLCENQPMPSGRNALEWNGHDRNGKLCPSGMYLICVQASGRTATKTVMVVNQ